MLLGRYDEAKPGNWTGPSTCGRSRRNERPGIEALQGEIALKQGSSTGVSPLRSSSVAWASGFPGARADWRTA